MNGQEGDAAVNLAVLQQRETILFDCGNLSQVSLKDLLKIKLVCISHTHIDHFFGFDHLIRANIPHFRTVEVVGPKNISTHVSSKLKGYLWNLLEPNQVNFRAFEIDSELNTCSVFMISNTNRFEPVLESKINYHASQPLPLAGFPKISVQALSLDHGTQVLGFRVSKTGHYSLDVDAAKELGFTPGPWVSKVQEFLQAGEDLSSSQSVRIGEVDVPFKTLVKAFKMTLAESVVYVTDIGFSKENVNKLVEAFGPTSLLICEANYQAKDHKKAFSKYHLTTRQAALLSKSLNATQLVGFHFSAIYKENPMTSQLELDLELSNANQLSDTELLNAIQTELSQNPKVI